jgi:hypothetical protein
MIQERFDLTINLIKKHEESFSFFRRLLDIYQSTVLVFSFFSRPSMGNRRQNVLAAYRLRTALSQDKLIKDEYAVLIDGLGNTKASHICVSVFITGDGAFTIFSDFDAKEMIGALFVSDPPEEVPMFSHLFINGVLLSRERD